jgi:tetratricopeptide (TPR) repeat protein
MAAAALGQRGVELRSRMNELRVLIVSDPEHQTEPALSEAKAAIAELTQLDDPESLTGAWNLVTIVAAMRSDYALLEESAQNRLVIACRAGLRSQAIWSAGWLLAALTHGPTPVEEGIRRAEQVHANFADERPGESYLALLYMFAGRHAEAEDAIERGRRTLIERGQTTRHAAMSMNAGWIALLAGEPERAEHDLRAAADVLESARESTRLSTVTAVLAEVLYRLGRDEEAEHWTRRSEQMTSAEDVSSQALWRSTRAKLLARRGEADGASRLSVEAVDWARRSHDALFLIGHCLSNHAEVLRMLERTQEARPVLEEALTVYERKGIVPSIEGTRALLAEISA